MPVVRLYRREETGEGRVIRRIAQLYPDVTITTELCYNVELDGEQILYRNSNEFKSPLFTLHFTIQTASNRNKSKIMILMLQSSSLNEMKTFSAGKQL